MKEKTRYKTIRRGNCAPDIAVFVPQGRDVPAWRCDLKGQAKPAKNTLINENPPKELSALSRRACFADWSAETGDFGRKQFPEI